MSEKREASGGGKQKVLFFCKNKIRIRYLETIKLACSIFFWSLFSRFRQHYSSCSFKAVTQETVARKMLSNKRNVCETTMSIASQKQVGPVICARIAAMHQRVIINETKN